MTRMILMMMVMVFVLPFISCDCRQYDAYTCLVLEASCHFNYSYVPPICDNGAPTDGCGTITNPTTCQSNPACLYDPYVNYCFVNLIQPISIFNCPYWDSFFNPVPTCAFHNCYYNATNLTCNDVLVAPPEVVTELNDITYKPFATPYAVSFADQNEMMYISTVIPLPLPLNFVNFSWYTMVIGWPTSMITANNQTLLQSMTGPCGTATAPPETIPNYLYPLPGPPIVLPSGETPTTMYTYLVNWIATTGSLDFSPSDPRGVALSSYFGTGLTNHLLSASLLSGTGNLTLVYAFPWYSVCLLDIHDNLIPYAPSLSQAVITVNWFSQQAYNTWQLWQSVYELNNQVSPAFFTIVSNFVPTKLNINLGNTVGNTSLPCTQDGTQGSIQTAYTLTYLNKPNDGNQIAPSTFFTTSDMECYGDQMISVETVCS